jgi:hypothetical protein
MAKATSGVTGVLGHMNPTQAVKIATSAQISHMTNVADQYVATGSIIDFGAQVGASYQEMTTEQLAASGLLGLAIPSAMLAIGVRQSGGIGASFNPMKLPQAYELNTDMRELQHESSASENGKSADISVDLLTNEIPLKFRGR